MEQGLDGLQKYLHLCVWDKSSLSIGRVNMFSANAASAKKHSLCKQLYYTVTSWLLCILLGLEFPEFALWSMNVTPAVEQQLICQQWLLVYHASKKKCKKKSRALFIQYKNQWYHSKNVCESVHFIYISSII